MSGKPSSGLGTSSYFAGGEKPSKVCLGSGAGAAAIAGGGMGFGPVRSGRPIWWYMVSLVEALTCPGAPGSGAEAETSSAASGATVAVAVGDSSLGVPEPEGLRFRGVDSVEGALSWPYAGGVVSISKRFEGEASGSSASRTLFLLLLPDNFVSFGMFIKGGCLAYR